MVQLCGKGHFLPHGAGQRLHHVCLRGQHAPGRGIRLPGGRDRAVAPLVVRAQDNDHLGLPRRLGSFIATLFVEGWAFYCEELLEQMGYIAAPIQRLGRLSDQLWRAARIILDVSLHTKAMPVDEAVEFLVEQCRLEPANAVAEVRRYTQTPTQPQCYLMGKLAILEIVDAYRHAHSHASMRQIHDVILACGALPPRLMNKQLGLER